jgi:hypothetical protein
VTVEEEHTSVPKKTRVLAGQPIRCWDCNPVDKKGCARWNRKKGKPSLSSYKESGGKTARRRE